MTQQQRSQTHAAPRLLIEAAEAYPAFEQRMLAAKDEVLMGFRIFDPDTKLRSDEARKIGDCWADLLRHTLERGVRIDIALCDFDAVAATDLHECTWTSVRKLQDLRDSLSPDAAPLTIRPLLHPAELGLLPKALFWPAIRFRLWQLRNKAQPEADMKHSRVPGLRALLDRARELNGHPATHHQKLAVFDRRWLYLGGLDLDDRRYDDNTHDQPTQETWHDVQVLLDDPDRAAAAATHLETFADICARKAPLEKAPGLLRSLSTRRHRPNLWFMSPKSLCSEIGVAHFNHIAHAEQLIYLETQYFRAKTLARALANRAREQPGLRLILLLPGAPDSVAFEQNPALDGRYGDHLQTRCIDILLDAFGDRCLLVSPAQPRRTDTQDEGNARNSLDGAPIIYVHAKLSIFDDTAAIVGSANLNGRSLNWDTEVGVDLTDPGLPARFRDRMHRHWWPDTTPPALVDFHDDWRSRVSDDTKRAPEDRKGFLLPYNHDAARATSLPLPGAPEDMV
ncbi:phospholipase D family protein [Rhodalgimonas zhirmunskyi]|uniref:Phospholipase D n=1 Tax=Rhodalgimonas zhirmunskyi TaxID=2964767 RepID=A0AAJ1U7G3_9RHOB|nr:phospholipase D-like domain-containing protein [Rhodoalgimonas zhirmunskyi]MDQ2094975.1 phospholipase D-like domain-containing protein [Rhodoalgimonas zhirmunskyi]